LVLSLQLRDLFLEVLHVHLLAFAAVLSGYAILEPPSRLLRFSRLGDDTAVNTDGGVIIDVVVIVRRGAATRLALLHEVRVALRFTGRFAA
jgi:hypothetical protein